MEDYIVCGGEPPRYLDTLSYLFILGCTVVIVDCTHVHHVVYYNIIRTFQSCAIVDCTHIGSTTVSFEGMTTLHR